MPAVESFAADSEASIYDSYDIAPLFGSSVSQVAPAPPLVLGCSCCFRAGGHPVLWQRVAGPRLRCRPAPIGPNAPRPIGDIEPECRSSGSWRVAARCLRDRH